jgi:hypothetical protein
MSFWGVTAGLSGETTAAVSIANHTAAHVLAGGPAVAGYRLNSDGTAEHTVASGGAYTAIAGEWLIVGLNSDFAAQMTYVSGATLTTTPGAGWWVLSTTRTWSLSASGTDDTAVYLLEIRRVSDSVVVDAATITFQAFGSP